jgi:hypothetical protein
VYVYACVCVCVCVCVLIYTLIIHVYDLWKVFHCAYVMRQRRV